MTAWWQVAASCLLAAVLFGVIWIRRRYVVVTVVGISMTPSFHDGDRLLLRRSGADHVAVGTAVVLRAPTFVLKDPPPARKPSTPELIMVKRVAAVPGEAVPESVRAAVGGVRTVPAGMFVVLGDNPAATDSRRLGFVAAEEILGPVVLRLCQRLRLCAAGATPAMAGAIEVRDFVSKFWAGIL